MTHSIIAPSAAHIWGKPDGCTAYPLMAVTYPETEESDASREGTAAHELGFMMIESATLAQGSFPRLEDVEHEEAENGVLFTEEMYDGAKIYADDVIKVMRSHGVFGGEHFGLEEKLKAPGIHALSEGTPDCYLYSEKTLELFVWDFKFGYEVVEAFENWQTINYMSGILDKFNIDGFLDQKITVRIRIVQPRAYHREGVIREWAITAAGLRGYFNTLRANAHISLSDKAVARSGSHCKHCSARHTCDAALRGGVALYEAATHPTPLNISPEALGVLYNVVLRARKQLEALETGYEAQIKNLIRSGVSVPGLRVDSTTGREKWSKSLEEVESMGSMLGKDLVEKKLITPNQARKLGIDGKVISAYSEIPHTGYRVVPDDGSKARFIFSQ